VNRSVLNPSHGDVFTSVCPDGRDPIVPFCGRCKEDKNGRKRYESIGAALKCIEGCEKWSEVNYVIMSIFFSVIIVTIMYMLTQTYDSEDVIFIVLLKIILNFYQVVGMVVFSNIQTLTKPFTDLFLLAFVDLERSLLTFYNKMFTNDDSEGGA
jgi:NADH:ubiquinone oxidoreductase subunit 3 (subunit A)